MLKRNKTIVGILSIAISISFVNASVAFASDEQTCHTTITNASGTSSSTYNYLDMVTTNTDEASIINAINSRGTKTIIVNVNNSTSTGTIVNTPLISKNILNALKASTEKTLVIISETATIAINGTADGQIQFTRNKGPIVGFTTVGNANYYLNSNGIMQTGWVQLPGDTWYHFNQGTGVKETNWLNDKGTWYYLNSQGEMVTNTTIDGCNIDVNGAYIK